MKLPPLSNWENTRDNLHRATQVVGAFKKALVPQQLNALHLSLFVTSEGLMTERLQNGGRLALNFVGRAVEFHPEQGEKVAVPLSGHNPATLASALLQRIPHQKGLGDTLCLPSDSTTPFTADPSTAADYARALYAVYTALARFRARLLGTMTPMVVWPHGFDLSFLWFRGNDLDEHSQPHMNFGFSPGSAGFPRPYLYAYAWPAPDDITSHSLPAPARWFSGNWKGVVVDYDNLTDDNPEAQVEALSRKIYRTLL